jgi:D-tyrosyl-tRNA(Tyr) deacylase
MRVVIQRVSRAKVKVADEAVGAIEAGVILFLGIGAQDSIADIEWLVSRITKLRIWENEKGRMAHSILETGGDALVISQITLFGSLKKGNRPSFNRAAAPDIAKSLYEKFITALELALGKSVSSGRFGAEMHVDVQNDGPVTLIIDSRERDF